MKMTLKQTRENLPETVANKVLEMAKERHIRQIGIRQAETLYFAEDAKYYAYFNGKWGYIECGGEWGGYKVNDPINTTIKLPVGAFVIETEIFLGKHLVSVIHNNGIKGLEA